MGKRALLALLLFCLLAAWGLAQDQGQGQDQGPSSGGGGQSGQFGATLFLSGTVVLGDGQPAAELTQVELICQGTAIQQVYTSSGGFFSFQIDLGGSARHSRLPLDASISSATSFPLGGGMDPTGSGFNYHGADLASTSESINLSACELQAKLAGFQSTRILLGLRRVLDDPDVGVLVLHNSASAETAAISAKTLAAPKDALQAYEKALQELGKTKVNFAKTSNELEKAVGIYPEFAAAWYLLGEIRLELQDHAAAREAFEHATVADPQYANPYVSLAMLEIDQGRWEEAAQFSGQALELDSRLVRAHYFHALANVSLGRLDVAEESVLQVQASSSATDYPLTHYMLGWIVSQKGDFLTAAAEYRRFLEIAPTSPVAETLETQLASWTAKGLIPTLETSEKQD